MKLVLVLLLGLVLAGGYVFQSRSPAPIPTPQFIPTPSIPQSVDERAAFAIFTEGTFRIFTAAMYHERAADIFITAADPNVIIIKKPRLTWANFFETLPMKLNHDCLTTGTGRTFCTGRGGTLKFYLNGERQTQVLDLPIRQGDKLLVSFGPENDPAIAAQLKRIPQP